MAGSLVRCASSHDVTPDGGNDLSRPIDSLRRIRALGGYRIYLQLLRSLHPTFAVLAAACLRLRLAAGQTTAMAFCGCPADIYASFDLPSPLPTEEGIRSRMLAPALRSYCRSRSAWWGQKVAIITAVADAKLMPVSMRSRRRLPIGSLTCLGAQGFSEDEIPKMVTEDLEAVEAE